MLKRGIVVAALLVGCAVGVGVREVVFPARAAGAATYAYRLVPPRDLAATVKERNPSFKDADYESRLAEGINDFGRSGWRFNGCVYSFGSCAELVFEQGGAAGLPPPPATMSGSGEAPTTTGINH
jgi:hypothetical protein